MHHDINIREVELADVETVASHRAAMFFDMGRTTPDIMEQLKAETRQYLHDAIPLGEYIGWLAGPSAEPRRIVAGAGVQVRRVLPFPYARSDGSKHVAWGSQAVVINVYTEPAFRRQGYARRLMEEVLAWASAVELESLVLHAATDGRALYEQLGFAPTTEMRFMGDLSRS
jgi:GNAT superfamily N-acetyltransferase